MAAVAAERLREVDASAVLRFDIPALRSTQQQWSEKPVRERLQMVRRFRRQLANHGIDLARLVSPLLERSVSDTLSAEVLPLAEAARFFRIAGAELAASGEAFKQWAS